MPTKESKPQPEHEHTEPYLKAASYSSDQSALQVYNRIQARLFGSNWDLSTYRIKYQQIPHVVVLGVSPPPDGQRIISDMIASGSPANLPKDVINYLIQRRAEAQRLGPWVEGHYRPGRRT
jgi:hypothetical protein